MHFKSWIYLQIPASFGGEVFINSREQDSLIDISEPVDQLDCSSKNSAYHLGRCWMLLIGVLSASQIASLTPDFLLSVSRMSWKSSS